MKTISPTKVDAKKSGRTHDYKVTASERSPAAASTPCRDFKKNRVNLSVAQETSNRIIEEPSGTEVAGFRKFKTYKDKEATAITQLKKIGNGAIGNDYELDRSRRHMVLN